MAEDPAGPLLLDTHVWLWIVNGQGDEIAPSAVRAVEAAGDRGDILVSAISVWEVAMLEARRRVEIAIPIEDWVRRALEAPGTKLLQLTPGIAIESTRLPGTPHGDPADRILIASARASGARLVTCDHAILDYASTGYVRGLDARP